MIICSAFSPSAEATFGLKSLVPGEPVIRVPPMVMKRVNQSTVASEKSLAPMKDAPATSPVCSFTAASWNSSQVVAGLRPAASKRSLR